jgi:hypothetical protein
LEARGCAAAISISSRIPLSVPQFGIRERLGYSSAELHLLDIRKFRRDLDQRARIIEALRNNADHSS